jgi:ribosomal protein S18 acetylase RimI-like enzyme
MNIRVMVPEDYEKVHDLWTSVPGMGLRSLDDSPEGIARFLRRNPTSCFVAEEGPCVAGAILCGHDGRRGYIYHAAVHPDFRRQGIGRALVDAAMDALRTEGIMKAALVVFATNANGNEFWESIGFTRREDLNYRNKSINDVNR